MMRSHSYPRTQFPHPELILDAIVENRRPSLSPDKMHGDIAEMISTCWSANAADRPPMTALVRRLPRIDLVPVPPNLGAISQDARERRRRAHQRDTKVRYDIFISYRVATDADTARRLHDALKAVGLAVFLDKDSIAGGADWRKAFLEGLQLSRIFVPLLSDAGLASIADVRPDGHDDNCLLEVLGEIKEGWLAA
jgi:hypothetical protein